MKRNEAESLISSVRYMREHAPEKLASKCAGAYPTWESLKGTEATAGLKFQHGGELYAVNQPHIFSDAWVPGQGTESLYRLIPEWFSGDREDPIPYKGNLALELGKFYTQDGVMYECIEDTIIPVHDPLSEMARYVKEVTL